MDIILFVCLFVCLFVAFRSTREFFIHMQTSPFSGEELQINVLSYITSVSYVSIIGLLL